jgi:hypothetical protein
MVDGASSEVEPRGAQPNELRIDNRTVIRGYNLADLEERPQVKDGLVNTYREVFGGEPWNEWKVCVSCSRSFGKADYQNREESGYTKCCDSEELRDYHPPSEVIGRLESELDMPDTRPFLFAAESGADTVGFMWGYGATLERVVGDMMKKYFSNIPESGHDAVTQRVMAQAANRGFGPNISYVSELGVKAGRRGDAKVMAGLLQAATEQQVPQGYGNYLFWTSPESTIYPVVKLFDGEEIYKFGDDFPGDERLLMMGQGEHLLQILRENPGDKIRSYFVNKVRENRGK